MTKQRGDDSGFTLIELLVAMMVTAVLMSVIAVFFTNFVTVARDSQESTDDTYASGIASEMMQRTLSVAVAPSSSVPAVVEARADSLVFYANYYVSITNPVGPVKVSVAYNASKKCVEQTITPASGSNPVQWRASDARATCLAPASAAPQFSYYDKPYANDSNGNAVQPLTLPAGGLTDTSQPAVRGTIRAVSGTFSVEDSEHQGARSVETSFRANLTNLTL